MCDEKVKTDTPADCDCPEPCDEKVAECVPDCDADDCDNGCPDDCDDKDCDDGCC